MSTPALAGLRVLLGVSGGIAAYKAAELVRRLRDAGASHASIVTMDRDFTTARQHIDFLADARAVAEKALR